MRFVIIGVSDCHSPWFPPEVIGIIRNGRVFSGGRRHHEIVEPLLPEKAEWIDITAPLDNVFERYAAMDSRHTEPNSGNVTDDAPLPIIVFASGDPLFFGFANTVRRKMPDAEITVYPTFNSLQMLAHRLVLAYHDMRIVSLTGRPWHEFDRALIERAAKIGVLTDKEHTPAAIARRMTDYGYDGYTMYVGEHLGNPDKESVSALTLHEAAGKEFGQPNCLILCSTDSGGGSTVRRYGLPDSEFALLDGRQKMITKMPVRLLTLQALDLPRRHVLWDIGFCTGSVSIEARLLFPHLQVEAFEIRPECEAIIADNARRFGAPGINVHIGDFLNYEASATHTALPRPDAVFIGGHGGRLKEIMAKAKAVLADGGCMVMNSVKAPRVRTDSHRLWDEACSELGLRQEQPLHILLDDNHPIEILKCEKRGLKRS